MTTWRAALGVVIVAACGKDPAPPPPPQAPIPALPITDAAGDADFRVLVTELTSSQACERLRGGFHGLRSPDHADVVSGVLWIRECEISSHGAQLELHVAGTGWTWVDTTKHSHGGTFVVQQYVRFHISATLDGALDIAYARTDHVMTLWFTPTHHPEVEFTVLDDLHVDREGAWSSVIGAIGTVVAESPAGVAHDQANTQGTQALETQLANGFAVTVNLCTGLTRVGLGRPVKGQMSAADVGETERVPVEIQPGGVIMTGPQRAGDGMNVDIEVSAGAVRFTAACAADADEVATEFLAGHAIPSPAALGSVDARTKARLRIKPTSCPVVIVATPIGTAPVTFAWQRPASEIARSTGGPLIHCQPATGH